MSLLKWMQKKQKAANEGNLKELYEACNELAQIHTNKEDFEEALEQYKEAKRAAEAVNNVINIAVSHRMIGQTYSSLQDYDSAINHELKYLELARSQEDAVEEQRALATLGHTYLLKADTYSNPESREKQETLTKAKKFCLMSLHTCAKLTHINKKELVEMQARLHLNLGIIVEQQSDIETAVSHFNKAIHLCKSIDIWEFLYRSYNVLACLYFHQSKYEQALENCDKAFRVAERLAEKNEYICDILLLKSDVLFVLPNFRGAKQCLLRAYKLNTTRCDEVERKLRIVAAVCQFEEKLLNTPECDLATQKSFYESLGDGCAQMCSYSKALEYYHLMLETSKRMGEEGEQLRPCYVSLSQTYKDNKQYDLAIKYFKEELKLNSNNPEEAAKTALNIAEVLEIKEADIEDILQAYKDARGLAQTAKNHKLEFRVLSSMSQVLKDKGRLSESRKADAELENLLEKFGPITSGSESEEENTSDIGADIRIEELSDNELENERESTMKTRRKCPATKFKRNEKGEFPLHTACIAGNLNLVKKLLDQGHPVNVRDHSGWLPLHEACNHGYVEIVSQLLDNGAWINDRGTEQCDGVTPLLDAASCGNLDVMQLLLDRGASPVMRTNRGETVLDCLVAWRKRYIKDEKRDLDSDTLSHYNSLVKTLKSSLTKAGHKPDSNRRPISRSPSPSFLSNQSSTRQSSRKDHKNKNKENLGPSAMLSSSLRRSIDEEDLSLRRSFSDREKIPRLHGSSGSLRRSTDEEDLSLRRSVSDREKMLRPHGSGISLRKNSDDGMFSGTKTEATKEYEEAMKALRRKPTVLHSSSPPPESRSALISEEEVVDDWLIDDVGTSRGVKRRRTHEFDGEPTRRASKVASPERRPGRAMDFARGNSFRPVSPVNIFSDSNDSVQQQLTNSEEQSQDFFESVDMSSAADEVTQQHNLQPRSPPMPTITPRFQPSLSAFGVVRSPVPRQHELELPTQGSMFLPPPTTQPFNTQSLQLPLSSQIAPPPSIKVRVEGKLLLIFIPTSSCEPLTIAWLAEEAAKRYYNIEGVEPKLTLRTEDGAMLSPQDPVTLLLSYREVEGVVMSWKIHPVTERYKEACSELGTDTDDYLEKCLDISQTSFSLNLKGCSLDAPMAKPVFRASTHTSSLQHLILSDNRLGDSGMQLVAELIVKLPHLRELDLQCNGITYEGLNIVVNHVSEHQACKRLESLNLSYNRLGNSSITLLNRFLGVARAVNRLSVESVGITVVSFLGCNVFSFENIEELYAGYNTIGPEGVRALLRSLAVNHVAVLSLPHTGCSGVLHEVADWLGRGDPCRLQLLDLAHCGDQDSAFTALVRNLERAPLLDHLELSCPEEMDEMKMQSLYKLSLKVLRLPGVRVDAKAFPSVPALPPVHDFSCLSIDPPPWGFQGPFGLLTNNTCPFS